nr:MAG TPA: hypothetical protein [Caudoviricetes sp.]
MGKGKVRVGGKNVKDFMVADGFGASDRCNSLT